MFNRRNFLSFLGVSPFLKFGKSKKDEVINIEQGQCYRIKTSNAQGFSIYYKKASDREEIFHRLDGPAVVQSYQGQTYWGWDENNRLIKSLHYFHNEERFIFKTYKYKDGFFLITKLIEYYRVDNRAVIHESGKNQAQYLNNVDYRWFENQIGVTFDQLRDFQV